MTAEEFLQNHLQISHFYDDKTNQMVCYSDEVQQAMIEFAKLHVTEALNTIYEKGLSDITTWDGNPYGDEGSEYLDFDKLIEAYPLDKIK
jgi:hypothetical protein